jgi:hypothetical protein
MNVPVELRTAVALNLAADELKRAMATFPAFNSAHEGWAVIWEKLDELWDEVKANDPEAARIEAIQVAAMALRYLIDVSKVGSAATSVTETEEAAQP